MRYSILLAIMITTLFVRNGHTQSPIQSPIQSEDPQFRKLRDELIKLSTTNTARLEDTLADEGLDEASELIVAEEISQAIKEVKQVAEGLLSDKLTPFEWKYLGLIGVFKKFRSTVIKHQRNEIMDDIDVILAPVESDIRRCSGGKPHVQLFCVLMSAAKAANASKNRANDEFRDLTRELLAWYGPAVGVDRVTIFTQRGTPLLDEIAKARGDTLAWDPSNAERIQEAVDRLSVVIEVVSKDLSQAKVKRALEADIAVVGTYEGLVAPALTLLDRAYVTHNREIADLVSPVISDMNPTIGALLKGRLGLPQAGDLGSSYQELGRFKGMVIQTEFGRQTSLAAEQDRGHFLSRMSLDGIVTGDFGVHLMKGTEALGVRPSLMPNQPAAARMIALKLAQVSSGEGPLSGSCSDSCRPSLLKIGVDIAGGMSLGGQIASHSRNLWGTLAGAAAGGGFQIREIVKAYKECTSNCEAAQKNEQRIKVIEDKNKPKTPPPSAPKPDKPKKPNPAPNAQPTKPKNPNEDPNNDDDKKRKKPKTESSGYEVQGDGGGGGHDPAVTEAFVQTLVIKMGTNSTPAGRSGTHPSNEGGISIHILRRIDGVTLPAKLHDTPGSGKTPEQIIAETMAIIDRVTTPSHDRSAINRLPRPLRPTPE